MKTVTPTTLVLAGERLTYTLVVGNDGNEDVTNVTAEDVLPPGTSYVPDSASGGASVSFNAGTLTWTLAALPVGESEMLAFEVTVNAPPPTTDITDTASVTGSTETRVLPQQEPTGS
ncbi:MAG: DUF11 domain-containing protein [Chloroflexi bacterium]|nr:DUF11 domain-containing protein [Chloroflexota bacterium]